MRTSAANIFALLVATSTLLLGMPTLAFRVAVPCGSISLADTDQDHDAVGLSLGESVEEEREEENEAKSHLVLDGDRSDPLTLHRNGSVTCAAGQTWLSSRQPVSAIRGPPAV
jgi:hypothetical protein